MREIIGYLLDVVGLREKTDEAFRAELLRQSVSAGLDASYIAAVMRIESNFDPHIFNRQGAPALGLIQFWRDNWPPIAARAGHPQTEWLDLLNMTAAQQVPFVIAYYKGTPLPARARGAGASPTDYYMATFMPAFVGAPVAQVLGVRDSNEMLTLPSGKSTGLRLGKVYEQNAGLDENRDGKITVGDVGRKIEGIVSAARQRPLIEVWTEGGTGGGAPEVEAPSPAPAPAALIASAGLVFFCPSCGEPSSTVNVEVR